jgi:hypothetical protein
MESLDAIALRHGTDKASSTHRFTAIYEPLFAPLRNEPITLLEIGVETGASLRMWEDYFSCATIVGIDINPVAKDRASDRSTVFLGDQGDAAFLASVADRYGSFKIVIDDGGHFAIQQLTSLQTLWPYVEAGGIYAVEDIHTSYLSEWHGEWRREGTFVEYLKGVVDDVNVMWHNQPVSLPNLASLHIYPELAVLVKRR